MATARGSPESSRGAWPQRSSTGRASSAGADGRRKITSVTPIEAKWSSFPGSGIEPMPAIRMSSLYEDLLIGVTRFFRDDVGVRGAGAPNHPGARRARDARRSDPRLGGGLRHWPGGVFDRDPAARAAGRTEAPSKSRSSPRTSTRRRSKPPAPASTRRSRSPASAGAARTVLHAQARRVPGLAGAPRVHRLRPAQPDSRRAVHQDGSDHVPQPADLLPAARAEDGADAVPFLAQAGRVSVPRLERDARAADRRVRHDRRARQGLSQAP